MFTEPTLTSAHLPDTQTSCETSFELPHAKLITTLPQNRAKQGSAVCVPVSVALHEGHSVLIWTFFTMIVPER